ncbi:MAG: hypothetical protein ACPGU6_00370 [Tenacibaculum sp.]
MKHLLPAIIIVLFISCNTTSELKKEFPCESSNSFSNLKKVDDIRNLFSLSLPANWKINLYYDDGQTSIYTADTTLSLTKTTIIDATLIHAPINFNASFKQKMATDNAKMGLQELQTKNITLFKNKEAYYNYATGKKGKYPYQILNTFIKSNSDNFLHIKTQIYGDSLVNERLCKAINLIDKIQLK